MNKPIRIVFAYAGENPEVIIDGDNIMFWNKGIFTTIEGLQLNKSTTIKEFPDLKDNPEWRKVALERFKAHFSSLLNTNDKVNYVISDLTKYGYKAILKQRAGFRPERIR